MSQSRCFSGHMDLSAWEILEEHSSAFLWGQLKECDLLQHSSLADLQAQSVTDQVYLFPRKETYAWASVPDFTCALSWERSSHTGVYNLCTWRPKCFFKNRTNPNKTLTPDCPLLTSHQAAKARVVWIIKNLWHHHAAFSWKQQGGESAH